MYKQLYLSGGGSFQNVTRGSVVGFSWEEDPLSNTLASALVHSYDQKGMRTLRSGVYHIIAQLTVVSQARVQPVLSLQIKGNEVSQHLGDVGRVEDGSGCCYVDNCKRSLSTLSVGYIGHVDKGSEIYVALHHAQEPFSPCKSQLVDTNSHHSYFQAALY
jgi:hypothetical protein